MNKKQKIIVYIAIIIIIASLAIWLASGGEVFTKNQVLVEKKDELFGTTYKVWENKFIWGLDLSLLISGVTVITAAILYFVLRNKSKE
ncbi:hypothetical protein ABRY23_09860 [Melioribacteraceae bacterium 4301-Me]|uniref:hypothetical protein n=1 Tax=Pyranulibacter aquaticus TaxID=3163344 RepID=UPI00359AF6FC